MIFAPAQFYQLNQRPNPTPARSAGDQDIIPLRHCGSIQHGLGRTVGGGKRGKLGIAVVGVDLDGARGGNGDILGIIRRLFRCR